MELTSDQKNLIETAIKRYGVTGLARELGVTRYVFYDLQRRGRGLTPDKFEQIRQLMQPQATQMTAGAPSASIAPTQPSGPSDTAAELQLLSTWLQGLSKTNLIKVIEFVAELKRSEET